MVEGVTQMVREHPEYVAMLANLTSTQARCSKLEQENRELRAMKKPVERCTFCRKPRREVKKMVASDETRTAICDECYELCTPLMNKKDEDA